MRTFAVFVLIVCFSSAVRADDIPLEVPVDLDAAQQLGAAALGGAHFRIEPRVRNDGRTNHYRVGDGLRTLDAMGDRMARERGREFEALAALKKIKESDAYAKGLDAAASATLSLTRGVISDPLGTLERLPQGLGTLLSDLGAAVQGVGRGAPASREDNALMKDLIGYNTLKRRLAHELNVDPYSSHVRLQTELNDVAWAMFAGGAPIEMALIAVPAGLTVAIRAADRAEGGTLDWKIPPATLRQAMMREVRALGLSEAEAEAIVFHRHCSLRHQSLLVSALADMQAVQGREAVMRHALDAGNERACRHAQHAAELVWSYHRNVKPVLAVALRDGGLWLRDRDGTGVLVMPADHLAWTAANAALLGTDPIPQALWLDGTASTRVREALAVRKIALHERVRARSPATLNVAAVLLPERAAPKSGEAPSNRTGTLLESVGT
ncbi:MAG: hypothetical protein O2975_08225, partial [Proteobacteria bacterium]|nr:hypothetical protein [Pseudomonadota bacterium]